MEPAIRTNIFHLPTLFLQKKLWLWFLILQMAIAVLLSLELWIPLTAVFFIPFIIFTLFEIRFSIFILIITLFIDWFSLVESYVLRPVDLLIIITIFAYLLRKIYNVEYSISYNELSKPLFIFIAAILFSLIDAYDFQIGLKNFFRHIELFLLFFILADLFNSWSIDRIRQLIEYFIYISSAATLIALIFIFFGEYGRAFGVTGVPLAELTVSALIASVTFLIMSNNRRRTRKYLALAALLFLGLVMTQTRGAWLSFTISFLFLSYLLLKKSVPGTTKKLYQLAFLGLILIIILFVVFETAYIGLSNRIEATQNFEVGTIQFRLILWHAGITSFLANPLNGIGLGQFPLLSGKFSSIGRSDFFKENIRGLGAHNILISYLSETGIVGILALLFFYFSMTKMAAKTYNRIKSDENLDIVIILRLFLFFVVISSAYAGAWFSGINGAQFMIFLAMATVVAKKA